MAQYPSAVKTFTTKSAGDVIQPSHIGDLQDEVTAIEDGLLNGTAAINSSRITAPSAQVTNSTATNLSVTGTFIAPRAACQLTHSASQGVAHNALTGLSFDTETVSHGGMHSTSANSSRITFVSTGQYLIGASVQFAPPSAAGSYRQMRLRVNNATDIALAVVPPFASTSAGIGQFHQITMLYDATSTTAFVTLLVSQDSGSTMSVSSGTGNVNFWAAKVGA